MKRLTGILLIILFMLNMGHTAYANESGTIISGNYMYQIVNEEQKEITITGINSTEPKITVPEEIDGYKTVGIGYYGWLNPDDNLYNDFGIQGTCKDTLQELIIPEGVKEIGIGAFADFTSLKKVYFPESLIYIRPYAFLNCSSLDDINIPQATVVELEAFRKCTSLKNITISCSYLGDALFDGEIDNIHIAAGRYNWVGLGDAIFSTEIKKVTVDKDVELITFSDADFHNKIKSLIINGKYTKVKGKNNSNTKFVTLYTVPDAKCISWARKEKISYAIKTAGDISKIDCIEKNRMYRYVWNKTETTLKTYKYNKTKKKWKITDKSIRTKYNVYGKSTKNGKYKLITQTTKNQIKTKYKYIKVKPEYRF